MTVKQELSIYQWYDEACDLLSVKIKINGYKYKEDPEKIEKSWKQGTILRLSPEALMSIVNSIPDEVRIDNKQAEYMLRNAWITYSTLDEEERTISFGLNTSCHGLTHTAMDVQITLDHANIHYLAEGQPYPYRNLNTQIVNTTITHHWNSKPRTYKHSYGDNNWTKKEYTNAYLCLSM